MSLNQHLSIISSLNHHFTSLNHCFSHSFPPSTFNHRPSSHHQLPLNQPQPSPNHHPRESNPYPPQIKPKPNHHPTKNPIISNQAILKISPQIAAHFTSRIPRMSSEVCTLMAGEIGPAETAAFSLVPRCPLGCPIGICLVMENGG